MVAAAFINGVRTDWLFEISQEATQLLTNSGMYHNGQAQSRDSSVIYLLSFTTCAP